LELVAETFIRYIRCRKTTYSNKINSLSKKNKQTANYLYVELFPLLKDEERFFEE